MSVVLRRRAPRPAPASVSLLSRSTSAAACVEEADLFTPARIGFPAARRLVLLTDRLLAAGDACRSPDARLRDLDGDAA